MSKPTTAPETYRSSTGALDAVVHAAGRVPQLTLVPSRIDHQTPTIFETPNRGILQVLVKRTIDLCGAIAGLLLFAPLMFLAAIAIRATSPGPVLFVQMRAGRHGVPFKCYKFRTMRTGADAEMAQLRSQNELSGPAFKMKNDPRITSVGRLLRKYSIDEMPQFLNVLLGDMSLVGPRPLPVDELLHFLPHHWKRLSVVPGLSGLWQVSGRSNIEDFEQWIALDLRYIAEWSIALDLKILALTPLVVLKARGAS